MSKKKKVEQIQYSKEQIVGWEKYRDSLYKIQEKSHDLFEKAITFISSGTLALTVALHDNIVPAPNAKYVILIALGWLLLATTLFVNLVSHYLSSKSTDKTIDAIDHVLENNLTFEKMISDLNTRNKLIDKLNKLTILTLGLGLLLVLTYVTLNIYNGKTEEFETTTEITKSCTTQNQHS